MAIVIDTGTPTSQTYFALLAQVALWMNRNDLGAVIPSFVFLAESRIARDLRIRKQITTTSVTAPTATRSVALPLDWLELLNLSVGSDPDGTLKYVTRDQLDAMYPEGSGSGQPTLYTIEGDNLLFGPTPDSPYPIEIVYYARFAALLTMDTNWLYSNHPSIYLYACLREGALFVKDAKSAAEWDGLYKADLKALQDQDDQATHSGSVLTVRTL